MNCMLLVFFQGFQKNVEDFDPYSMVLYACVNSSIFEAYKMCLEYYYRHFKNKLKRAMKEHYI